MTTSDSDLAAAIRRLADALTTNGAPTSPLHERTDFVGLIAALTGPA